MAQQSVEKAEALEKRLGEMEQQLKDIQSLMFNIAGQVDLDGFKADLEARFKKMETQGTEHERRIEGIASVMRGLETRGAGGGGGGQADEGYLGSRLTKLESALSGLRDFEKAFATAQEMIKNLKVETDVIKNEELDKVRKLIDTKISFIPVKLDEFRRALKEEDLVKLRTELLERIKKLEAAQAEAGGKKKGGLLGK
ncbi:MAG: hypothetical protein HY558_02895 [Euryarchaeota archaeon]|nr:hypothetical protein [Euryarchaeota archaeon]